MPKDKNTAPDPRTFTVSQKTVMEWINDHEDQVLFAAQMGIIDDATKAAIIANDEKVKILISNDPEEAERVAEGESRRETVAKAGGDIEAETANDD